MALYYRGVQNNAFSAWKTIAFTDSDITGNAATATKLKDNTAFTAWGQTFFENGKPKNVNGNFTFNAGQKIGWNGDASHYYINSASIASGLDPSLIYSAHGGHCFISRGTNRVIINPSGNVTIGESDLAGSNDKLFVDGRTSSKGYIVHHINDTVENKGAFLMQYFSSSINDLLVLSSRNKDYSAKSNIFAVDWAKGNLLVGTTTDNGSGAKLQVNGKINTNTGYYIGTYSALTLYSGDGLYIGYETAVKGSSATLLWGNGIKFVNSSGQHLARFNNDKTVVFDGLLTASSRVLIGNGTDDGSTNLQIAGTSAFYGSTTFGKEGVSMQVNFKCPVVAEDRVTIGGATLRWDDEIKALRLNTSLAATGELSAGGAGTEGGNTGGGGTGTIASPFSRTFTPNEKTSFTFSHDLPYYDVVVQVYEWDSSGMCWNMVLADIEIQNNDVTVTLGRKENVEHKIVVR